MISVIIYSKDRASQLDALLKSMYRYIKNINLMKISIIYSYSSAKYKEGYQKLKRSFFHKNIIFINELSSSENFKDLTIKSIDNNEPFAIFFVDDDVFIRSWFLNDGMLDFLKHNEDVACVSLRMSPEYDYCYTLKISTPPPPFEDNQKWMWIDLKGDWGFPMSLDGHIFRTDDILHRLRKIEFCEPQSLEQQLARTCPLLERPYMVCYQQAIILNVPINKVQICNDNHAGLSFSYSVEMLNDLFLKKCYIDITSFVNLSHIRSPHHEVRLNFAESLETSLQSLDKKERSIVIIITSFNNAQWHQSNLDSVFKQKYQNYRVIYIDDASTDGTCEFVREYVKKFKMSERFCLIKNQHRLGSLANHYYAIHSCNNEDIIVILDGDDWLSHENVLAYINKIYLEEDCWLTYGSYKYYPDTGPGACIPMSTEIVSNNGFRKIFPFPLAHLRTFNAWLFKMIKEIDLFDDNGEFFAMAGDVATMFPMIEMARKHFKFIPDILCIYNVANPINDSKISRELQSRLSRKIRQKIPYEEIDEKDISSYYVGIPSKGSNLITGEVKLFSTDLLFLAKERLIQNRHKSPQDQHEYDKQYGLILKQRI